MTTVGNVNRSVRNRSDALPFTRLVCLLAMVAGAFSSSVRAASVATTSNVVAQASESGAQEEFIGALGLKEMTVGSLRVFYGPPLTNELEGLRNLFANLVNQMEAERRRTDELLGKSEEIIREVNRLVGWEPDDEIRKLQGAVMGAVLTNAPWVMLQQDPRVFLLPRAETKIYLRGGGQVPGLTYDRDTGELHWAVAFVLAAPNTNLVERRLGQIVLPGDSLATVSEFWDNARQVFSAALAGPALHELVEFTILKRLSPRDGYFRWFSDGFANAVTELLQRRFLSAEAERKMVETFSTERFQDLKSSLLLRYWPGEDFCFRTSFESEGRLVNARYSYATFEARRLIEKHGPEVLKKTLDLALADTRKIEGGYTTSDRLIQCLQRVTGEDLEARFREYQPFRTLDEGLEFYQAEQKRADVQSNSVAALTASFRLLDLQPARSGQIPTDLYAEIAERLHKLGRSDEAMAGWENLIERHRRANNLEAVHQFQRFIVAMALLVGRPELGESASQELLTADPKDVPGLSLRAVLLARKRDYAEAQRTMEEASRLASAREASVTALAQRTLAQMLANGEGVEKNLVEAYKWISLAAESGEEETQRLRKDMLSSLSPSELSRGIRELQQLKERLKSKQP